MDSGNNNDKLNKRLPAIYKALGDDKRHQILILLSESNLCVGAMASILKISKPAVSQHLKILREAGLVKGEKIGYWTHYQLEKDLLQKAARELEQIAKGGLSNPDSNTYTCLRKKDEYLTTERRALKMCENCCEQPEKLKKKPETCTPEQIKECHGDNQEHPCECNKKE